MRFSPHSNGQTTMGCVGLRSPSQAAISVVLPEVGSDLAGSQQQAESTVYALAVRVFAKVICGEDALPASATIGAVPSDHAFGNAERLQRGSARPNRFKQCSRSRA